MNVSDVKTGTILQFTLSGIERWGRYPKCANWRWRVVDFLTESNAIRLRRLDTKDKKIEVWSTKWLRYMEEVKK